MKSLMYVQYSKEAQRTIEEDNFRESVICCSPENITLRNISNTTDGVSSRYPSIKNRVENTMSCGVFWTKF